MTGHAHLFDDGFLLAFDANLLADDLRLFPFAHKFVLVGIVRVKLFDVEVFDIGDGVGQPPGDMPVVTDYDARRAGEAGPDHIDVSRRKMALVPDGGRGLPQMRVIAEDGQAGGGHGAIDRPVIAAPQHAKAAQHFQLFVLLKHSQVDARIGYAGWHNQGVAWVVAGFQLRGAFWSQLRDEVRAYDFRLPVAAQVPSHHFGPLDGIGNLPGFWFETQDGEFDRQVVL